MREDRRIREEEHQQLTDKLRDENSELYDFLSILIKNRVEIHIFSSILRNWSRKIMTLSEVHHVVWLPSMRVWYVHIWCQFRILYEMYHCVSCKSSDVCLVENSEFWFSDRCRSKSVSDGRFEIRILVVIHFLRKCNYIVSVFYTFAFSIKHQYQTQWPV